MNKFKKLGVSALAGSLAAFSAQAAELSFSGDSSVSYTSGGQTAVASGAQGVSADVGMSFSASGEMDNGWTVSTAVDTGNDNASSSAQLTIGMGDLGTLQFNQIAGSFVRGLDDKLPTAWEETSDLDGHTNVASIVGNATNDGSISYKTPALDIVGGSVQLMLDYDTAPGAADGGQGATVARSTFNSGTAWGVTATYGGLSLQVGHETLDAILATRGDENNSVISAQYAAGPFTIGYAEWEHNDGAAGTAGADYTGEGMSVAFNVNDNLTISYGTHEDNKEADSNDANTVDVDIDSIQAAYTMGSMAVKVQNTQTDNPNFVNNTESDMSEINVSFSF
jgi:outer membrane protein OmpU